VSIRTRILLASTLVVLLPILILAIGIRREMSRRLTDQYTSRVESLSGVIKNDLEGKSRDIAARLASLTKEVADDNRFRLAAVEGIDAHRPYLLDYGRGAMQLSGLSMLAILDDQNRVVTSGHFRNEYGRVEPALPRILESSFDTMMLITARRPDGEFLALARVDTLRLGGRLFSMLGGVSLEHGFLTGLAHDHEMAISLVTPTAALSSDPRLQELLANTLGGRPAELESALAAREFMLRTIQIPMVPPAPAANADAAPAADPAGDAERPPPPETFPAARLVISYPVAPLNDLLRSLDQWLALVLIATASNSLVLAIWLSARISRPIGALAQKTAQLDLDHLDADFSSTRKDEVGVLSRFLAAMTERLRTRVAQLREAESRATLGELARQVNHDVRNGFTPIRNVVRHLAQVAHDSPKDLAAVFLERQATIETSLAYLEDLAANYARLSANPERRRLNLNEVIRQVVSPGAGWGNATLRLELAQDLPMILADPTGMRRIVENLVRNARESLGEETGLVTVTTEAGSSAAGESVVRMTVRDTGSGIRPADLSRIFDHFYTTKERGTGLGLSIVKRLVSDYDGAVSVESVLGQGSRFTVTLPAVSAAQGASPPAAPAAAAPPDGAPHAERERSHR
jgi:signal transduction histidine kinase